MVGGMMSAVVLTLVVLPVVYFLWRKHTLLAEIRRSMQFPKLA